MSWREDAVDEVVARLAQSIPKSSAQVERMPDQPGEGSFRHPYAAVWVGYHSSKSTADKVMRLIRFDIGLLTRQLHSVKGSLNFITAIEETLMGARLTLGGSELEWDGDQFTGHSKGVWRYTMSLSMKMPVLPTAEPASLNPIKGPALKFLTLDDEENGDTSIGVDPDV